MESEARIDLDRETAIPTRPYRPRGRRNRRGILSKARIPKSKARIPKMSLEYSGAKAWNTLPKELKLIPNYLSKPDSQKTNGHCRLTYLQLELIVTENWSTIPAYYILLCFCCYYRTSIFLLYGTLLFMLLAQFEISLEMLADS